MCWYVHYWESMSKTHTIVSSMLSFVCMVHPGIVVSSLWSAQLVTRITHRYCHHVRLPSPSLNKYHTWVTLTEGEGKRRARDSGWKTCQSSVTPREEGCWDSRWQETLGFSTAYVLLPWCSPHNVLHSPSTGATYLPAFCWEEKDKLYFPSLHTYITTPVKFLQPTPSLSSSPISPSPHSFLTTILSLSTIPFHPLLSLPSLTTVPVCQECIQPDTGYSSDYWRLL